METKEKEVLGRIANIVLDKDNRPYVVTTEESKKKHYRVLVKDKGQLFLTTIRYKGIEGRIIKLMFKPYGGGKEFNLMDKDINYLNDILKSLN